MFRTGIDISPSPLSTVSNLLDAERYLNVSRPGCYAYPGEGRYHTARCGRQPARPRSPINQPTPYPAPLPRADMLELGAPVVGPHAARPDPQHPSGRHSMCNSSDGSKGDSAPRLTLEQGMAEFAAWCTVSSPLILGFDLGNDTEYDRWWPVVANPLALQIQASWAGLAGKLLQQGDPFQTMVPHGASCEDMKDTRALPSYSIWGKPVHPGPLAAGKTAWAVTALNSVGMEKDVELSLAELGMSGSATETDVWSGTTTPLRGGTWQARLPPGGHRFVLLQEL